VAELAFPSHISRSPEKYSVDLIQAERADSRNHHYKVLLSEWCKVRLISPLFIYSVFFHKNHLQEAIIRVSETRSKASLVLRYY